MGGRAGGRAGEWASERAGERALGERTGGRADGQADIPGDSGRVTTTLRCVQRAVAIDDLSDDRAQTGPGYIPLNQIKSNMDYPAENKSSPMPSEYKYLCSIMYHANEKLSSYIIICVL